MTISLNSSIGWWDMVSGAMMAKKEREDTLAYLPRIAAAEFRRGQVIYNQQFPPVGLYVIVSGRVKVSIVPAVGHQIVTGIFGAEEFFGECAMVSSESKETATALEATTLMAWTPDAVEEHIKRHPKLGIALIQMFVQRSMDYEDRLASMAYDKTSQRLALSLLQLARRLGTKESDGLMRIPSLTHQVLSEYIGTSREIVTTQMNHLRDEGYLCYSRQHIDINGTLTEYLGRKER